MLFGRGAKDLDLHRRARSSQQIQGTVTSYTYSPTYPGEVATVTDPLEQNPAYKGACKTGSPTYTMTNYYGSDGGSNCATSAPNAWLLACTVEETGGIPASPTTNYTYNQNGDTSVDDLTDTMDPDGNHFTTAYDSYGDVTCSSEVPATPGTCATGGTTPDVTTTTYEPDGEVATTVEPNGNASGATASLWTTTETYDAAGNQLTETDPGATVFVGSGSSCSSGTVTLKLATTPVATAKYAYVSITGVSPTGYNGSYQVLSSNVGSHQITYFVGTCPSSSPTGGTVTPETVNTYDADNNATFSRDDLGNMAGSAFDLDDNDIADSNPGTSLSVTSGSCSSSVAQLNFASTTRNPAVGTWAFASDVGATGFNGAFQVTVSTSTYVKYDAGCSGTPSAGGFVAPSGIGHDL